MTFPEILAEKLPAEEREELIQFLADAFHSVSPQDKDVVMVMHLAEVRAKKRRHGGLITEEQASEKIYNHKIEQVYEIARKWAK